MKQTRRRSTGGSRRPPTRPRAPATYSVGYSKPPREHRFKPGQSGNPKGRPKGTKNTATVLREILDRKVEMRIGGILRKVSLREAMLMRFAEAALKGDTKAAGSCCSATTWRRRLTSIPRTWRRKTSWN
jgi:hypothetical protein